MKWQVVAQVLGGSFVGVFLLVAGIFSLSGIDYSWDGDKACVDCFSKIQVNSSYWEICAEHAGEKDVLFKKLALSRRLWVNLDKVKSVVLTEPFVETEILVPTVKRYATVDSAEFGYLRPLRDGDCFIKRQTTSNPSGSWFVIHGLKSEDVGVKWSFLLDDAVMEDVSIDPYWSSTSSLRGWWKFDGTVTDAQGNFADGVLTEATNTSGKVGSAYLFDGVDDFLNVSYDNDFNTSAFTYTAWVYRKSAAAGEPDYTDEVFASEEGGEVAGGWGLEINPDGSLIVVLNNGVKYGVDSLDDVPLNAWSFVAFTFNGSVMRGWVNGVSSNSFDAGTTWVRNGASFLVGKRTVGTYAYAFNGSIDDVRFYNRSLSQAELLEVYLGASKKLTLGTDPSLGLVNASDLISWYHFDYDANDVMGVGNGTVSGAVLARGRFGNGYSFDGANDAVTITNNVLKNLTGDLSISAWVYSRDCGAAVNKPVITQRTLNSNSFLNFWIDFSTVDTLRFLGSNASPIISVSCTNLVNKWLHVGFTRNSTTFVAYVNGTVLNSAADDYPPYSASVNSRIGQGDSAYFNGVIDEVLIFNRTLSSAEMASLYAGQKSKFVGFRTDPSLGLVNTSSLVGWWHLDGDALDSSGFGRNGTVSGALVKPGRFDRGYSFDGVNDNISVSSPLVNFSNSFVASTWVYNTGNPSRYMFYIGTAASNGVGLYIDSTDNIWLFVRTAVDEQTTVTVPKRAWTNIVLKYNVSDSNRWSVYKNGVFGWKTSSSNLGVQPTLKTFIGSSTAAGGFFNGTIDEFTVYDRMLSDAEIAKLYTGEKSNKVIIDSTVS